MEVMNGVDLNGSFQARSFYKLYKFIACRETDPQVRLESPFIIGCCVVLLSFGSWGLLAR